MKMCVVAIRDRAAEAFARPMFVPALGVAHRSFSDEVNRVSEDNNLYLHSDDFDLYDLGEYDDSNGGFNLHETPQLISQGKIVKVKA